MKKRPRVEGPIESRVLGVSRESKGETGIQGRVGNLGANREFGGKLGVLGEWGVLSESRVGRESKVWGKLGVRRLEAGVRSPVELEGPGQIGSLGGESRFLGANRESEGSGQELEVKVGILSGGSRGSRVNRESGVPNASQDYNLTGVALRFSN
ncbi:unnamed protein product [Sphagnum balticum]